jgi:hypothetical protein
MWKSLRTTAVENLNRELRREAKTQASFSTEEAASTLLFGLVFIVQIKLRKIDGHRLSRLGCNYGDVFLPRLGGRLKES